MVKYTLTQDDLEHLTDDMNFDFSIDGKNFVRFRDTTFRIRNQRDELSFIDYRKEEIRPVEDHSQGKPDYPGIQKVLYS